MKSTLEELHLAVGTASTSADRLAALPLHLQGYGL